jgi:NAD/NADP transhydrogenase beta subunit
MPGLNNVGLMVLAIVLGGGAAWYSGKIVKMTDMPQMVAIYNGMGGGAAAAIAALEFLVRLEVHVRREPQPQCATERPAQICGGLCKDFTLERVRRIAGEHRVMRPHVREIG